MTRSSPAPSKVLHGLGALVLVVGASGCYSLGFTPVAGISEVAVPIFGNDTLRRELNYDLTRHVRREVLEATPLHLAREGSGAAVLRGSLRQVNENVIVSGDAEEVLAAGVTVTVVFGVYRDGELLVGEDTSGDGKPNAEIRVKGYAEFDTARGQDRASATDEALRDAAELVVFRLEARHDDRYEPNDSAAEARAFGLQAGREVALLQRNPDWFALEVAPRSALKVTHYFSRGDMRLQLLDADGEPLADAETRDSGRIVTLLAGATARTVALAVTGDDSGAPYQLEIEALDDDPAEPDSTPKQATQLPGGQSRWLVRRLLRDDDYVAVAIPVGHALKASVDLDPPDPTAKPLEPAPELELRATDELGGPRDDVAPGSSPLSLEVPATSASRRVLLRVSGDGRGLRYRLTVELTSN